MLLFLVPLGAVVGVTATVTDADCDDGGGDYAVRSVLGGVGLHGGYGDVVWGVEVVDG